MSNLLLFLYKFCNTQKFFCEIPKNAKIKKFLQKTQIFLFAHSGSYTVIYKINVVKNGNKTNITALKQ